jgi:hypothetical protein
VRVLVVRVLGVAAQGIPGVVDYHVEAAEVGQGGGDGGVDRVLRGDVQCLLEDLGIVVW